MAAKRITGTSINWAALAERVPEHQKSNFISFKAKSDNYLRRVLANPESAPKIDWALYKKQIAAPGLVESFQKGYEALKIPYPENTLSAELDSLANAAKAAIEQFKTESNKRIQEYEIEKKKVEATIPYSQMTMEEYFVACPESALDSVNNPTLWPHTPETQTGYVEENAPPPEKH